MNLQRISRLLWALTLVALPVTSFKYLPFMGSGTIVRPLALYPLVLLMAVLALRQLRGERIFRWPGATTILFMFGLSALGATLLGDLLAPIPLFGVEYWDRALRAIITLVIGVMFFLAAVWMHQEEEDLIFSVRWMMVGLAASIVWGIIQFIGLNTENRDLLNEIQQTFSIRGTVKNRRVSGFAYEPSWLASQLVAIYMPWLIAALMTGLATLPKLTFKNRLWRIWEPILLLGAILLMFMTYSRSGLATLAGITALTALMFGRENVQRAWGWFRAGFNRQPGGGPMAQIKALGSRALILLTLMMILAGAAAYLADHEYISRIWTTDTSDFWKYMTRISFSPRLSYWIGAMAAFDENPITGVGLGASSFRIYANLPDQVLVGVPEITQALDQEFFPNPKNLYFRLLSETGLIGFSLFMAFWLALLAQAMSLLHSPKPVMRFLSVAGMITIGGLFLQAVSLDSFALPEFWVNIGILAGMTGAARQVS